MKDYVISGHGWRIAGGENRENSQTTDLSERELPVHGGLRGGLAAGGEAARDVGAAGGGGGGEAGAVAGRAAGKVR